jgi:glycosyltransferase involved in cell wall biosynthesis
LKIIQVIPNLKKGGAERIVIDIVRTLVKRVNCKVKLILFENHIEYNVDDILNFIEIIPSSATLSIVKKNRFRISELQDAIELFQPDIIHTHLFESEIITRSCYYPQAKWFTHSHDRMKSFNNLNPLKIKSKMDLTNYFEKLYLIRRYKKNGGNNFIAISQDIQLFLKSIMPRDLQFVHLLQNAIDVKRFIKPYNLTSNNENSICNLVSIGRLDKNKNHQFLINVVLELKKRKFPVHLTIIGEGEERALLETKIANLNLMDQITLKGLQDNVHEFLWLADVYVHSALTEGFGLTILEAMAAGLPVVTLDGGGNRDLIEEGENGFLIEKENSKLFADKIIEVVNNSSFSAYNKTFAMKFDISNYVEKLIAFYTLSLNGKH